MSTVVITFGTYDLLHVGHVNILKRAKEFGDKLVVGVSSDALNFSKKGSLPVYSDTERMEIVSSIRYVDQVFKEDSLELKRQYIQDYGADILVMGSDWEGKFDDLNDICRVVYLPRTECISTTSTKRAVGELYNNLMPISRAVSQ
jgi:glycerol-3-phosphate cytidylyltransferase